MNLKCANVPCRIMLVFAACASSRMGVRGNRQGTRFEAVYRPGPRGRRFPVPGRVYGHGLSARWQQDPLGRAGPRVGRRRLSHDVLRWAACLATAGTARRSSRRPPARTTRRPRTPSLRARSSLSTRSTRRFAMAARCAGQTDAGVKFDLARVAAAESDAGRQAAGRRDRVVRRQRHGRVAKRRQAHAAEVAYRRRDHPPQVPGLHPPRRIHDFLRARRRGPSGSGPTAASSSRSATRSRSSIPSAS